LQGAIFLPRVGKDLVVGGGIGHREDGTPVLFCIRGLVKHDQTTGE
jgi:hypothetical protein